MKPDDGFLVQPKHVAYLDYYNKLMFINWLFYRYVM